MSERQEILVIKHGALGDFVMTLGKIQAVRERHPDARFTLLTQGWLIPLAKKTGWFQDYVADGRRYNLREWYHICKEVLADRKWDIIYDIQSNDRTLHRYQRLARFLTRHPMKWGQCLPLGWDFHCTPAKLPFTWRRPTVEHLDLVPKPMDLSFCHGDRAFFHLLPERYVLLIPGCSAKNPQKRWPAERFRRLTEHFATLGMKSVVMGTKAEQREIAAICEGNPHAVDFMDRSGIPDIPDLALGAEVVIGNDTGPTHLAHFAGARTVLLFTDYDFGRAAAGVPHAIDLHAPKIDGIGYEAVERAAADLMKEKGNA